MSASKEKILFAALSVDGILLVGSTGRVASLPKSNPLRSVSREKKKKEKKIKRKRQRVINDCASAELFAP